MHKIRGIHVQGIYMYIQCMYNVCTCVYNVCTWYNQSSQQVIVANTEMPMQG